MFLTLKKESIRKGLNFTSGMVNSWNKFCFQGGYLEARVSLPGKGNVAGYWPAIWTLGNLGRAGFGSTVDGLWPYSYNTCDSSVLPNQANPYLSKLPGQRLNACVCKGDHPSPGIGRGAPEIDMFEATVEYGGVPSLSMSYQVAPFDFHSKFKKKYTKIFNPGQRIPGQTKYNMYLGDDMQQTLSALHYVDSSVSGGREYQVYGFEYEPGPDGYIQWYADGIPVWRVDAKSVGPNEISRVSQRVIPEEPMYIIMNLGISENFGAIDMDNLEFPASLYIDYVRLYQHPKRIKLSCDPPDRPTAKYILNHPRAYFNRNYTTWKETGYGLPKYDFSGCKK
ncbi:hypothetical protein BB559_007592 [Furculomyces boomerangus]|nr:hypothetical protein BB559_007592 [Furculomyces boomerangus]